MKQLDLAVATAHHRARLRGLLKLRTLHQVEAQYMRRVLLLCEGNVNLAARILGIGRATLYRRLRPLAVTTEGERNRTERAARTAAIQQLFLSRGSRL